MVDWAQVPNDMHITCENVRLSNSLGSHGGSGATVVLRTNDKLDMTDVGAPIGQLANSIEGVDGLPGLRIRIGDLFVVSSEGNGFIPACSNFPAALNSSFGNSHYPNMGFVGYVTEISLEADQNQALSQIRIQLSDESWKWSQYYMLPLVFNRNDATKPILYAGESNSRRYSARRIVSYFQRLLTELGHSDFHFSYNVLPERLPDPAATTYAGSQTIWDAFNTLLINTWGTAFRLYSAGAGHMEVVRLTTDETQLRSIVIDDFNIISNQINITNDQGKDNKAVECVVGFGGMVKYFVGEGQIDNELVPAWDWWMDGYFLVIDNATRQPAMYLDGGIAKFVNPFNISFNLVDQKAVFVAPGSGQFNFVYGAGAYDDANYPNFNYYIRHLMNQDVIGKYCNVVTYGMHATLSEGVQSPIHEGRFKRWRLKDNQPHQGFENCHGAGGPSPFVFQDAEFFPRRLFNGNAKKFPGDPELLNETGSKAYRVPVGNTFANNTYTVLIDKNFVNFATHDIEKLRMKPGATLYGDSGNDSSLFEPIPDPDNPDKNVQDETISKPLFCKYDIITNLDDKVSFGPTETLYTAERIEVSGAEIHNAYVQFSQPQTVLSSVLDGSTLRKINPTSGYQYKARWMTWLEETGGGEDVNTIERYLSPKLYGPGGVIRGENGTDLKWYYPLRHGRIALSNFIPHQIDVPIMNPNKNSTHEPPVNYTKVAISLGIPRIEMFGFVHYEDKPEVENEAILSNLDSYYWTKIRSCLRYPRGTSLANRKIQVYAGDNQVKERQVCGVYDYDNILTDTLAQRNNGFFERICFYKSQELGTAREFDIQNQSLNTLGHHACVIQFPLNNAQARFEEFAADQIRGRIPSGEVTYYERTDIRPERNGTNIGISSVVHNFGNGWTLNAVYGDGIPKLKDMFEDNKEARGSVRDLVEAQSRNTRMQLTNVETYARFNQ